MVKTIGELATDQQIGTLVMASINNSKQAGLWTLAKAWLWGERQIIEHLETRHTLHWLDGYPYHMKIEEV